MPTKTKTTKADQKLSSRTLNRTLLQRQHLLRRADLTAVKAVEHLVGLQAQAPNPPYIGLWTRLKNFELDDLSQAMMDRTVVRIALQRGTIHLVTAEDCLALRPVLQPMLDRTLRGQFARQLDGVDLGELAEAGRELVEAEPLTFSALGKQLAERWPDADPFPLSQAVRNLVPLVQIPPRGVWGGKGQATHTSAESWLGRPQAKSSEPDEMVLRFLAAFGPASVADMQVWCGLTRLSEVCRRQRDKLTSYTDSHGTELFDLASQELADPDLDPPVRYLPDFDNVLLSYADRERIMDPGYKRAVFTSNGLIRATILVDGYVAGRWRIDTKRKAAVLTVEAFRKLTKKQHADLEKEGSELLACAAAEATSADIQITQV